MNVATYAAALQAAFTDITTSARVYLPHLLGALALLLGGWIVAKLLQRGATRLARRFDGLVRRSKVEDAFERLGMRQPLWDIVGSFVFWVVFLFFIAAATEALGLAVLTTWLTGVAYFLPRIVAAVLILLAGVLVANFSKHAIVAATATANMAYGEALAQVVRIVLLSVAVLIAVNGVGIDITVLTVMLGVVLGTTLGGVALAFGLGARTAVSNIIGSHYLRQVFRVGQVVRIVTGPGETVQGEIEVITATSVVLRSSDGRVVVPAKHFSDSVSTLVATGGADGR